MQIDRSYYHNDTIHRTLLPMADDYANATLSCGFLYKKDASCVQKNICFQYYGGLYVVSGTGVYVDAVTGEEYPITPGCVLQRMPGITHHTIIDPDSDWLEFYFCAGAHIFNALASLNLVTREPVFYVGENDEIFNRMLEYQHLFRTTDDQHAAKLLLEFQQLLCFLNRNLISTPRYDWRDKISKALRENCKVGVPIKQVAEACGIGYEKLRKDFPRHFGCSIEKYRIRLRINTSKEMLLNKNLPIKAVAAELGYCDVYAFCKQFKQQEGISPRKFILTRKNDAKAR